MRIVSLGGLHRDAVTRFASEHAAAAPVAAGEHAVVTLLDLGPGGRLGRHPAAVDQLLVVVAGSGDVTDASGQRVHLAAGMAVLWHAGEEHETTTETGITAVVVESAGLGVEPA